MLRKSTGLLSGVLLAALCAPSTALAQVAPNLLSESPFGIVSSTFTNSNTAPQTIINGEVCFTTGPVTVPLTITGAIITPCPVATGVDQGDSLAFLNSQACTSLGVGAVALNAAIVGANPPGTFPPGCYSSGGAMDITLGTTVTLNGAGVYIFRPGGALTTGQDSRVVVSGGACESDVFWTPIGATTVGANSAPSLATATFVGNILDAAGITLGHFANLTGRALAFGGTVTTDANTITVPSCASVGPVPTLPEWAMIALTALLVLAGFVAVRRRTA